MKLIELNGIKHPHILVRFLDKALGIVEKPYTDPVKIMIPTICPGKRPKPIYRKLDLFNITHTGQGLCVENKSVKK